MYYTLNCFFFFFFFFSPTKWLNERHTIRRLCCIYRIPFFSPPSTFPLPAMEPPTADKIAFYVISSIPTPSSFCCVSRLQDSRALFYVERIRDCIRHPIPLYFNTHYLRWMRNGRVTLQLGSQTVNMCVVTLVLRKIYSPISFITIIKV